MPAMPTYTGLRMKFAAEAIRTRLNDGGGLQQAIELRTAKLEDWALAVSTGKANARFSAL
jgi:hypothetical protein